MDNTVYDIAITGGGLAGLTLAIQAADAGYHVTLFEKESYPFHKVCGEYISKESHSFLLRCGLPLDEWALPDIQRLQVSDTGGTVFDFVLPLGGFGISRYKLDHALYKLALLKGVIIHTECKVNDILYRNDLFNIQTGNGEYMAKTAAGSFGKRSNLDVKWNRDYILSRPNKINHLIGVKYHVQYPHPKNTIALHNFENGYCGISQIEDGNCCVCYLTTAENLKKSNNSIQEMEVQVLSQNKQLKKILTEAKHLYEQPLTISQISFEKKTQVENHVLMLGDAAGMITPLCGNGMSMAMHSGKMAFETMQQYLSGTISRAAMENIYTSKWQQAFANRTRTGRMVQSLFGGRFSTAVFLRVMHLFPKLSRKLIEQTHGKGF
ncbi:MAG: NAD(P)/FAD-dependent oxidoreductase [Bacteroidota bacterium]